MGEEKPTVCSSYYELGSVCGFTPCTFLAAWAVSPSTARSQPAEGLIQGPVLGAMFLLQPHGAPEGH